MSADASSFRKLSHREHVLHRPEMYIGSVAVEQCSAWVLGQTDEEGESKGGASSSSSSSSRMIRRDNLSYSPGLLKVFDEIVVNAIDHATRTRTSKSNPKNGKASKAAKLEDPSDASSVASSSTNADPDAPQLVKKIQVSIDQASGVIEVSNDGDGIPVEKHEKEGVYVPELIFGHLLTSANYDDVNDGGRIVGGQNGIGAKACNIMSEWFEIEVIDRVRHLKYRQRFEKNMEVAGAPKIEKCAGKKSSLTVRFLPDYRRLGMTDGKLSDDMASLMRRRVWDATAVTDPDVVVWLDGKKLDVKSFERYIDLYVGGKGEAQRVYEKIANVQGWEIAVALSDGTGLQQISFVNGVATLRGGKHVDHVVSQISKKLCEMVSAKRKIPAPKPQYVKDNLIVFVRATIPGPRFDSQSKETLTTPVSQFTGGSGKIEVSDAFVDKLYKLDGLVDRIVNLSGAAVDKEVKKTDGTKRATISVPKLHDAEWAGTNKSQECTLILTEGDSAKASAIAGLSIVGHQKYGVFPLRGKVINPCDLSADKIAANAEVTALKKIIGLQVGKKYTTTADLRYGRIMLLTDADVDGTHIRGLLINLFLHLWPELLKIDGFLCTMLTPVIKVYPSGTIRKGKSIDFYNQSDYEDWRLKQTGKIPPSIYLKGLGSSGSEDAKDWFRNLRIVAYTWDDASSKESLMKSFDKKRADDRKVWLSEYDIKKTLDYGASDVSYEDFVERDLVHFSIYDLARSIPSVVDGLKVSQRKALFACRKRNLYKGEVRVAQLAAYAAEVSMYHHGEASMQGTLISMAQDYVGSGNNVPILLAIGQFGTRLCGGDDSASPRYIHTRLTKLAALLFPKEDDAILEYLDDDGHPVEPRYFLPIIPLILINGASGIGTGFSTSVPSYNPIEVVDAVREWIAERHVERESPMSSVCMSDLLKSPWHRGFTGTIEEVGDKLRSRGIVSRIPMTPKIRIIELPIGYWTENFKEALEALIEKNADIKSYVNESSDVKVNFTVTFANVAAADAWMAPASANDPATRFENELKMVTTKNLSTTNMHLFDAESRIKKYGTPRDIVDAFCERRLEGYAKRKETILKRLRAEAAILKNKVLFLELVCDGRLVLHGKKGDETNDAELEAEMESLGLERLVGATDDKDRVAIARSEDDDDEDEEKVQAKGSFKYLLGMPIASLTHRRKEALDAQLKTKNAEIVSTEEKTPEAIWKDELDALVAELK